MSVSTQLPDVTLSKTLTLDSTTFLAGNLTEALALAPRFSLTTSINSAGPITRINSHSSASTSSTASSAASEVGIVEWRSSAIGRHKTIVKAFGLNNSRRTLTLGALMKSNSLGSKRWFGGLDGPDIRWAEKDGTWQCSTADNTSRVLAILHSRIATVGTRIEISTAGENQLDTIVLTALLVLHSESDWKSFQHSQNRARAPVPSPYTLAPPRASLFAYAAIAPHVTALSLTLSTNSFINGLLSVGGQLMYAMKTVGNRTSISKYTWEEQPRLEEFASIEWHGTALFGKLRSEVTFKGKKECLDDFMFSLSLGHRMRRFGMPDFLPWLQWTENPPSWSCASHPGRMPLAILDRRFMTAGTKLEVTMEGLEYLDALVLTTILVVHSPFDWKRPGNPRRTTEPVRSSPRHVMEGEAGPSNQAREGGATPPPPGLARRASDGGGSRLSRVSGDSDIPAYSPPPVGMIITYDEDVVPPRFDNSDTPRANASMSAATSTSRLDLSSIGGNGASGSGGGPMSSMINLVQFMVERERQREREAAERRRAIEASSSPPERERSARESPPPSYHPPRYSTECVVVG